MIYNTYAGIGLIASSSGSSQPTSSGALYWDSTNNALKIVDAHGYATNIAPLTSTLSLANDVMDKLAWVDNKMREEEALTRLCIQHPGLKEAKEQFDIMLALVRNNSV